MGINLGGYEVQILVEEILESYFSVRLGPLPGRSNMLPGIAAHPRVLTSTNWTEFFYEDIRVALGTVLEGNEYDQNILCEILK